MAISVHLVIQVAKIQERFLERVKQCLQKDGLSLEDNPENQNRLAVAFVVNSSRLQSDVQRDLHKGRSVKSPNFKMMINNIKGKSNL